MGALASHALREDERSRQRDRGRRHARHAPSSIRRRRSRASPRSRRRALRPAHGALSGARRRAPTPLCASTTATARRPAPAATACAASPSCVHAETGKAHAHLRDAGRRCSPAGAPPTRLFTVDMGAPRFALGRDPAGRGIADTRAIELQIGPIDAPILHSPSAVSMGNPHAIFWVDDVERLRSRQDRPAAGTPPDLSRARQHLARRGARRAITSCAHLGARRRADQGLRLGGLRGRGRRRAAAQHRPQGARSRCPAATLPIEWRESDDHVLMTGPVEFEHSKAASIRRCSPPPVRRDSMSVEVVTFGCRLNAAESEVIRREAERAGLSDTVVVNTCAVTAEAVRQARQTIRALAPRAARRRRSWSPAARRRPSRRPSRPCPRSIACSAMSEKLSGEALGAHSRRFRRCRRDEGAGQRHHGGARKPRRI